MNGGGSVGAFPSSFSFFFRALSLFFRASFRHLDNLSFRYDSFNCTTSERNNSLHEQWILQCRLPFDRNNQPLHTGANSRRIHQGCFVGTIPIPSCTGHRNSKRYICRRDRPQIPPYHNIVRLRIHRAIDSFLGRHRTAHSSHRRGNPGNRMLHSVVQRVPQAEQMRDKSPIHKRHRDS